MSADEVQRATFAQRALTIRQPYASLLVTGRKTIETRSRDAMWHGDVLVHAARLRDEPGDEPLSSFVGVARLITTHHYRDCHGTCDSQWGKTVGWHYAFTDCLAFRRPVTWRRGFTQLWWVPSHVRRLLVTALSEGEATA